MDDTSYNPFQYTDEQLWSLGLSAISVAANGERHDILKHRDPEEYRKVLASWWDIYNADQYRETLDWLWKGGGREVFDRDWGHLLALSPEQITRLMEHYKANNPQQHHRFRIIYHYRDVIDQVGIAAWDIGRATFLARMAATSGYIDEEEAWETVMAYGTMARRIFSNWFQFAHSYLIGRQYSLKNLNDASGIKYLNATKFLLTDPESPWCRHPDFSAFDHSPISH